MDVLCNIMHGDIFSENARVWKENKAVNLLVTVMEEAMLSSRHTVNKTHFYPEMHVEKLNNNVKTLGVK